jgi:hypothetical protein
MLEEVVMVVLVEVVVLVEIVKNLYPFTVKGCIVSFQL